MLDWLVGNFDLLGISVQNWMLLVAASLVAYLLMMAITGRGRTTP